MKTLGVILAFFCLLALTSPAADRDSVTLAWDHSPGGSNVIAGYRVYWGPASAVYTNLVAVGYVTNATVKPLVPGVLYFFAATALDKGGLESEFSNEVSYRAPGPPPPALTMLSAEVQRSTNLVDWVTVTNVPLIYIGTTNGTSFYRSVLNLSP